MPLRMHSPARPRTMWHEMLGCHGQQTAVRCRQFDCGCQLVSFKVGSFRPRLLGLLATYRSKCKGSREYSTSAALTTCKKMNTVRLLSALTSDSEIKKDRASGLSLSRRELYQFPSRRVQCSADTTRAQTSTKALCCVQSQPTRLPQLCRIHAQPCTAVRASLPCSEALKLWACHDAVLPVIVRLRCKHSLNVNTLQKITSSQQCCLDEKL